MSTVGRTIVMSRVCLPDGSSEVDDTGSSSIDILQTAGVVWVSAPFKAVGEWPTWALANGCNIHIRDTNKTWGLLHPASPTAVLVDASGIVVSVLLYIQWLLASIPRAG